LGSKKNFPSLTHINAADEAEKNAERKSSRHEEGLEWGLKASRYKACNVVTEIAIAV